MKKCPMMMNACYNGERPDTWFNCMGAQCAAYVERINSGKEIVITWVHPGAPATQTIEKGSIEWSCAMMPREVWNDVEDSNA